MTQWLKIVENGWKCHGMLEFFFDEPHMCEAFHEFEDCVRKSWKNCMHQHLMLGSPLETGIFTDRYSQDRWVERLNLSGTRVDSWIVNFGHSLFQFAPLVGRDVCVCFGDLIAISDACFCFFLESPVICRSSLCAIPKRNSDE